MWFIPVALVASYMGKRFLEGLVDTVFRDHAEPGLGSILKCDLGPFEHTGVYVGDGKIVHLLGTGEVTLSGAGEFIGYNAMHIYVCCDAKSGRPLEGSAIAREAMQMVGRSRRYNIIFDNCHQFTSSCMTLDPDNWTKLFSLLEVVIQKRMNAGKRIDWRIWNHDGHYTHANVIQALKVD